MSWFRSFILPPSVRMMSGILKPTKIIPSFIFVCCGSSAKRIRVFAWLVAWSGCGGERFQVIDIELSCTPAFPLCTGDFDDWIYKDPHPFFTAPSPPFVTLPYPFSFTVSNRVVCLCVWPVRPFVFQRSSIWADIILGSASIHPNKLVRAIVIK